MTLPLKAANESLYWLLLLRDSNLEEVNRGDLAKLLKEVQEIGKMLGKSLVTMKKKN